MTVRTLHQDGNFHYVTEYQSCFIYWFRFINNCEPTVTYHFNVFMM